MIFLRCCPVCFKRGKGCKCGMSTDIEIKTDGCKSLYLDIKATGVEFEAWNQDAAEAELITMWFDLKDKEDRKAIKNLISHLQHQLQVCEEQE